MYQQNHHMFITSQFLCTMNEVQPVFLMCFRVLLKMSAGTGVTSEETTQKSLIPWSLLWWLRILDPLKLLRCESQYLPSVELRLFSVCCHTNLSHLVWIHQKANDGGRTCVTELTKRKATIFCHFTTECCHKLLVRGKWIEDEELHLNTRKMITIGGRFQGCLP